MWLRVALCPAIQPHSATQWFTSCRRFIPGRFVTWMPASGVQDVADEIASTGNRRWCGASSWGPGVGQAMGYNDVLDLANFLNTDVLISVGQLNQPSDWTMLVNWLSTSGWISKLRGIGSQDLS